QPASLARPAATRRLRLDPWPTTPSSTHRSLPGNPDAASAPVSNRPRIYDNRPANNRRCLEHTTLPACPASTESLRRDPPFPCRAFRADDRIRRAPGGLRPNPDSAARLLRDPPGLSDVAPS